MRTVETLKGFQTSHFNNNMTLFQSTGSNSIKILGTQPNTKKSLVNVKALTTQSLNDLKNDYNVGLTFKLEAMRLTYYLPSLPKSPYPKIELTDNLVTKMTKISDIQANHPFIELEIYKKASVNKLDLIAVIPLQNKGVQGYAELLKPYLTTGEVKLLGESDEILVAVNPNTQSINGNDWIQIECDYSYAVSGTAKALVTNLDKLAIDYLMKSGIISSDGVNINNQWLDFFVHSYSDMKILPPIRIVNQSHTLNSLKALLPIKEKILYIHLANFDLLLDNELEENLLQFSNLNFFQSSNTSRDGINWIAVITATKLNSLMLGSGSNLRIATADNIAIAFDGTGRIGGTLNLSGNSGYSSASLTARNNLIAKGWTVS